MNRLATRLLLATLAVAVIALAAVPVATHFADRAVMTTLPDAYRSRLQALTPTTWVLRLWRRPMRQPARPTAHAAVAVVEAVTVPEAERIVAVLAEARAARRDATILAVAFAIAVGAALAAALSRAIARPIAAVSAAASRLAAGEFGARVHLTDPHRQPLETRELADGFNAMSEAIERYEGERKAMIADVAHELRTPLAAMHLRLEAIEDGVVPLGVSEVALLRQHTDLLTRLVDDLRLLSQVDAGRLQLAPAHVDLNGWLSAAAAAARAALDRAGVRLALLPLDPPVGATFDPQRLTQVLHNLLDNAARFAPAGSTVDVAVRADAATWTLTVRDRGPGIPEEDLTKVFERFTQGRRRDEHGSGLGLAIVRTLARLHGGDVRVRNVPAGEGGGARFEVTLPRAAANETQT